MTRLRALATSDPAREILAALLCVLNVVAWWLLALVVAG